MTEPWKTTGRRRPYGPARRPPTGPLRPDLRGIDMHKQTLLALIAVVAIVVGILLLWVLATALADGEGDKAGGVVGSTIVEDVRTS